MRWALLWALLIGFVLVPFFLFEAQFNELAARITAGSTSHAQSVRFQSGTGTGRCSRGTKRERSTSAIRWM